MEDVLKQIVIQGTIFSAFAGVLLLFLKQWVSKLIEVKLDISKQKMINELEIEKSKILNNNEKITAIYPEMLEISYRLKNRLNQINDFVQSGRLKDRFTLEKGIYGGSIEDNIDNLKNFSDELSIFQERLYKYRAFVDEETFKCLHSFKRIMQDVKVIFDVSTRDLQFTLLELAAENLTRFDDYEDFKRKIRDFNKNSESIYEVITKKIKEKINIGSTS